MKKLFYTLLTASILTISCDRYLDVQPKTQIELDKLFENESGFKDALIGVYIKMKADDVYGARLTQTTIEHLTSSWDVTANSLEQRLGLFDYGDERVEASLSGIFRQQYSIISSINAILDKIDERRSVFKTAGLYELIKGECLALRAYIHLDLIRLYGPMPMDPTIGSELAYVTEFSVNPNTRIPYEQYMKLLMNDIDAAAILLKDIDPIMNYSLQQLRLNQTTLEDSFYHYRYLRMNYYAVKALEARAYLWWGKKDKAYLAAKEVIDAKNPDEQVKFKLGVGADFASENFTLTGEHIFGLYDYDMLNMYQTNYSGLALKKGTNANTIRNQLFGNTGTDIREASLWVAITAQNGSTGYTIRKYQSKPSAQVTVSTDFKQIPLIRISEMHLILAETAPFNEGVTHLKNFRLSRNLTMADPANEEILSSEIIKEYRKEFYAEGQAFYAYKRKNIQKPNFLFAPTAAVINYIIPLPKTENVN